jgi:hypothetical protein
MSILKKWPFWAVLAAVFSGVGTKYLPEKLELFNSNGDKIPHTKSRVTVEDEVGINMDGDVPYLRKLPILDNNLFIEQNYNELIFGGVNFELVKFAARTDKGVKPKVLRVSDSTLVLPVFDMPYLEFEYKGKFYTLEIKSEVIGPEDISLTYKIKTITTPTMALKPGIEYSGT